MAGRTERAALGEQSLNDRKFRIDLLEDREAGVFVATSKDIPGLVLEAETFVGIIDAIMEYGPELVRSNLDIPIEDGEFRFETTPGTLPRKSGKSAAKGEVKKIHRAGLTENRARAYVSGMPQYAKREKAMNAIHFEGWGGNIQWDQWGS